MSLELYAAYLVACLIVVLVPGPTVTLILANSIRHGTRAGLLNVLGTQVGLALMIGVVGLGLTSLMEAAGHWFDWLRLAGAAYLIWLGWKMIRSSGADGERGDAGAAARRLPHTRHSGGAQQPEDPDLLRRLLPAVHRSRARPRSANPDHGPDGDAGRGRVRQRLRARRRPRRPGAFRQASAVVVARERWLPDWRGLWLAFSRR